MAVKNSFQVGLTFIFSTPTVDLETRKLIVKLEAFVSVCRYKFTTYTRQWENWEIRTAAYRDNTSLSTQEGKNGLGALKNTGGHRVFHVSISWIKLVELKLIHNSVFRENQRSPFLVHAPTHSKCYAMTHRVSMTTFLLSAGTVATALLLTTH